MQFLNWRCRTSACHWVAVSLHHICLETRVRRWEQHGAPQRDLKVNVSGREETIKADAIKRGPLFKNKCLYPLPHGEASGVQASWTLSDQKKTHHHYQIQSLCKGPRGDVAAVQASCSVASIVEGPLPEQSVDKTEFPDVSLICI